METNIEEIWKDVVGYEGYYQVSNLGRVKSLPRVNSKYPETILKQWYIRKGYLQCQLSINNIRKAFYVHRLVAIAFIENPNNLPFINHKDEIKSNNVVYNLEWCTNIYNVNYGTGRIRARASLISKSRARPLLQFSIDGKFIRQFKSLKEASLCGFPKSSISRCCNGLYPSAVGFKWQYKFNSLESID
jgi:hypothetical protein